MLPDQPVRYQAQDSKEPEPRERSVARPYDVVGARLPSTASISPAQNPGLQQEYPTAQARDLRPVRHNDPGDPERTDRLVDHLLGTHIEMGGALVHEEDLGSPVEGAGQQNTLLLAARQCASQLADSVRNPSSFGRYLRGSHWLPRI